MRRRIMMMPIIADIDFISGGYCMDVLCVDNLGHAYLVSIRLRRFRTDESPDTTLSGSSYRGERIRVARCFGLLAALKKPMMKSKI
jgi:hypothetical protein